MLISALWTNIAGTRTLPETPAAKTTAQASELDPALIAEEETDALFQRQQQAQDVLAQVRTLTVSSAADRKAAAAQRLEDAKEQLRSLMMWVSDPEVLARLAQQLAQTIGSAARQFASGLAAEAGTAAATAATRAATATAVTFAATMPTDAATDNVAQAQDEATEKPNFAQRAYQDMASSRAERRSDQETVNDFKTAAQQVKALLEKARRELAREQASAEPGAIDTAIDRLDAAIDALTSTGGPAGGAGFSGAATTFPLSITI